MSKRAEEAAMTAYPPIATIPKMFTENGMLYDPNTVMREVFIKGYEQAEKDMIENAISWLKENASNYIVNCTESYPDAPFKANIGGKCWEDLRDAIKEEQ